LQGEPPAQAVGEAKLVLVSNEPATVRAFAGILGPMGIGFETLSAMDAAETAETILSSSEPACAVVVDEASLGAAAVALAEALQGEGARAPASVLLTTQTDAGLPPADARRRFVATLSLPLVTAEIEAVVHLTAVGAGRASAPAEGASPAPAERALKILVADDNRTNQKVIGKILQRAGHAVECVGDGQQAVDAACFDTRPSRRSPTASPISCRAARDAPVQTGTGTTSPRRRPPMRRTGRLVCCNKLHKD